MERPRVRGHGPGRAAMYPQIGGRRPSRIPSFVEIALRWCNHARPDEADTTERERESTTPSDGGWEFAQNRDKKRPALAYRLPGAFHTGRRSRYGRGEGRACLDCASGSGERFSLFGSLQVWWSVPRTLVSKQLRVESAFNAGSFRDTPKRVKSGLNSADVVQVWRVSGHARPSSSHGMHKMFCYLSANCGVSEVWGPLPKMRDGALT